MTTKITRYEHESILVDNHIILDVHAIVPGGAILYASCLCHEGGQLINVDVQDRDLPLSEMLILDRMTTDVDEAGQNRCTMVFSGESVIERMEKMN